MLSGRMIRILEYMTHHIITSYKEISVNLGINIRHVRYDIDKINDYLSLENLPLIEKQSKGVLVYPKNLDIQIFKDNDGFVYTVQERMGLMILMLLFDHKRLRLNRLSRDFQVSRSTIKNDLNILEKKLLKFGITIEYDEYFCLKNYNRNILNIANRALTHYLYLYQEKNKDLNSYQLYAKDIIDRSFAPIMIVDIIKYSESLCEKYEYELNDDEYRWFVANLILLVWYCRYQQPIPAMIGFDALDTFQQYIEDISQFEKLIHQKIDHYYKGTLIHLLEYINDNEGLSEKIDPLYIQSILNQLLELMSERLGIDFTQDHLLMEGLLKHIPPLVKRTFVGSVLFYDVKTTIPKKDQFIYETLEDVIKEIPILNQITNLDEVTYLAVHFIASMRRLKISFERRILIVCYHGYGSSTLLYDYLSSEFKVKIIDVIPSYKLSTYSQIDEIDVIISTLPLKNNFGKEVIVVSPLLPHKDYEQLIKAGFEKKETAIDYYSLNKKLDFLEENIKEKVLKIFLNELGHNHLGIAKSVYRVSDLLIEECIEIKNTPMDWEEAIMQSSHLLECNHFVKENYGKTIIKEIKKIGFYCVTDSYFALFHGKENSDVYNSSISLIVNKNAVWFDDKKVKVIFCLASKDKKDQIPAMILLMRMVKKTNFLSEIEKASSSKEVLNILQRCENEVVV